MLYLLFLGQVRLELTFNAPDWFDKKHLKYEILGWHLHFFGSYLFFVLLKYTFFVIFLEIILQLLLDMHHMWNFLKYLVVLHADFDATGSAMTDLIGRL